MTGAETTQRRRPNVLASLGQPKVAVMLALGFSSGLPFLLTGNTLGYWLRDEGTTLKAIGFLSWVGLAYSLKFLWAPIVDRLDAPLFGRFGRRRRVVSAGDRGERRRRLGAGARRRSGVCQRCVWRGADHGAESAGQRSDESGRTRVVAPDQIVSSFH